MVRPLKVSSENGLGFVPVPVVKGVDGGVGATSILHPVSFLTAMTEKAVEKSVK